MSEKTSLTSKTAESKANKTVTAKPGIEFTQAVDSPVEQILHLQRTIGNRAVQRLIESGTLQAQLNIGQPNDKYGQEADRIADKVMTMPEPGKTMTNDQSSMIRSRDSNQSIQRTPT